MVLSLGEDMLHFCLQSQPRMNCVSRKKRRWMPTAHRFGKFHAHCIHTSYAVLCCMQHERKSVEDQNAWKSVGIILAGNPQLDEVEEAKEIDFRKDEITKLQMGQIYILLNLYLFRMDYENIPLYVK
ncbi:uncharacterized protein LOC141647749 [Silene latifolia]|uniref:uncharacterized protein LOC141647749 n=1 Tax=Silene latifolia TaxID=37657 RepID=UPI003D787BC8